jgi:hypothetical protein
MLTVLLSLFGVSAASVALLVHELRTAPVAYEDRNGFHIIDKPATGFKIFKHRPVEDANSEETAVHTERRTVKTWRQPGSVAAAAK